MRSNKTISPALITACLCFFLVDVAIFSHSLSAFVLHAETEKGTFSVQSDCRESSLGETIMVTLAGPLFQQAEAHMNGTAYHFVPKNNGTGEFFTLLPLGLSMKPGRYDCEIQIVFPESAITNLPLKITVAEGSFISKKISVDTKFTSLSARNMKRIRKERLLLNEIYANRGAHWLGEGAFIFPAAGKIGGTFGEKRIFNRTVRSRHRGVDIRSPRSSPVKAANSGKVVLARNLYFGGNTVILDHGIGLYSIYCHLSKVNISENMSVKKGAVIGLVGSTGRATGPHLHWGTRIGNYYVNPLSLMPLPF